MTKHTTDRSALALAIVFACGLFVSACGESVPTEVASDDDDDSPTGATFSVGGTISGTDDAVTLSLNGVPQSFTSSPFTFTRELTSGSPYGVLYVSSAAGDTCTVSNGSGILSADVTNVDVACSSDMITLRYDFIEITGQLTSGDVDGDGIQDLVFTIRSQPGYPSGANLDLFRVLYGLGGGQFATPVDISRLGSSDSNERGHQLVALELTGDGADDFAISTGTALEVFSDGAGRSPSRIFAPGPSGAPLRSLDADENGAEDLVSIVWGGAILDYFNLYRNNGDGTFAPEERVGNRDDAGAQAADMGSPLNFTTGDFDGDGAEDILGVVLTGSGVNTSLALALLSGDGTGGFSYPAALDALSDDLYLGYSVLDEWSKEIAAGDFDGDGDLDVAITSTTDFVQLLTNDGAGRFSASGRVTVEERPIHVRVADFDNDGTLDLLTLNADARSLVITFGQGGGTFGGPAGGDAAWRSIQLDPDVEVYDVVVADIDGDGTPDVAIAEDGTNPPNTGRGSVQIYLAPGTS